MGYLACGVNYDLSYAPCGLQAAGHFAPPSATAGSSQLNNESSQRVACFLEFLCLSRAGNCGSRVRLEAEHRNIAGCEGSQRLQDLRAATGGGGDSTCPRHSRF